MPKAKITQTGADSAVVEAIVLRRSKLTRIVFKPQIVDDKQHENKPVKGPFLWRRRAELAAVAVLLNLLKGKVAVERQLHFPSSDN